MSNPNIVGVTTIVGNNGVLSVERNALTLVNNASGSGKIYKINQIYVSNVDSASDAINVTLRNSVATTPTTTQIVNNIAIPPQATLEVLSAPFYLKENQDIQLSSLDDSGDLNAVATWEEIS